MTLLPIEVNPEMLNKMHQKLGVAGSMKYKDILSFEPENLKTFSEPVCGVVLLFPLTSQHEEFRKKQAEETQDKKMDPKVYFMTQKLDNACGLVGVIHIVANNQDHFSFGVDSSLKEFLDKTADASPEERAKALPTCETLLSAHNSVAAEGHCRPNEDKHFHLIVLVAVNGCLYELDGLTEKPINHGKTSQGTFLEDAAKICKQYTEREKGNVCFSAVALTKDA